MKGSKNRQSVQKAVGADEMNLIGEIKALASEIQSMNMGDEMMTRDDGMPYDDDMTMKRDYNDMAMKEEDDMDDDDIMKSKVKKEAEETASDDADDRIEGAQPEESDEAMSKIGKQLKNLERKFDRMNYAIKSLANSLGKTHRMAKSNASNIEEMLDGIGITKDIVKSAYQEKQAVQKSQPITHQNNDILKAVGALLQESGYIDGQGTPINKSAQGQVPTGKEGLGVVLSDLTRGM